ncbi:hypothetical protein ECA0103 [Pectobacterium atrosepticum SCRI1043]|uniref:Uncharacterized protein n=1 Tax=Pectobacterium atrosepticum (strain SCRI 1043 / ATCC BAA-672) TaxID=218491 RepID=Q6DAZ9_PECAS|nr:hypothetical protein ECA0103 [Pectobacterium atrosepticum SCRI1043]
MTEHRPKGLTLRAIQNEHVLSCNSNYLGYQLSRHTIMLRHTLMIVRALCTSHGPVDDQKSTRSPMHIYAK